MPSSWRVASVLSPLLSRCCHIPAPCHSQIDKHLAFDSIVNDLCNAFRRGWNFETLTKKFSSLELTSFMVDEVLLQMKQPIDAKRALGFFHWSAKCRGLDHTSHSYCIIIHILVGAKMLIDARALLEAVLKKIKGSCRLSLTDSLLQTYNITSSRSIVFDLLVKSYSKMRMFDSAFDVCCCLEQHGFSLCLTSYSTLIRAVSKSDEYSLAWKIYEHMLQRRMCSNEITISSMIGALCREGRLQKHVDVLDTIVGKRCPPVVIVNTCLVLKMVEGDRIEEGMGLLRRMLHMNMVPDTFSYSLIIYVKVKLGNFLSAWEVYNELLKRGFQANAFVYTVFIRAHCLDGRVDEAMAMMKEMEEIGLKPYGETFNHLISGCSWTGRSEESIRFCQKMIRMGLVPKCSAFNDMISKLCENKDTQQADSMLTLLLDMGFSPDECTYSHLIDGYGREGDVQQVIKLYYEMKYREIPLGVLFFSSLVKSLRKCGKPYEAEKFIKMVKDKKLIPSGDVRQALVDLRAKNIE